MSTNQLQVYTLRHVDRLELLLQCGIRAACGVLTRLPRIYKQTRVQIVPFDWTLILSLLRVDQCSKNTPTYYFTPPELSKRNQRQPIEQHTEIEKYIKKANKPTCNNNK